MDIIKPDLSISIVLYENTLAEINTLIKNILQSDVNFILFLIDNSKTDNLRKHVVRDDIRIQYFHNEENIGFGRAHNIGIKKGILYNSTFHLVLNPDISFDSKVLQSLIDFMVINPDVGNVMPKVYYADGTLQSLCKLLPTPLDLSGRRFLNRLSFIRKRNSVYELKQYKYNKIVDIPNLSGCFMFMRTEIVKKVGGFDERFFMYLEDIDLNRRIHKIARTVCNPSISVVHGFRKESYANRKLLLYHIKSAIKYFNKWGWFFDSDRRRINRKTLDDIKNNL
ncbi:glycosyltransferase family 2 protein [Niabella aquatica]